MVLSTTLAVQETQSTQVMVDFSNNRVTVVDAGSDRNGSESAGEEESPRAETECIEYWVQVLRTSDPEEIEPFRSALKDQGYPLYHQKLITIEGDGALPMYKLRVGPITRHNKAKQVAGRLRHAGFKTAWIVPDECQ
jgi:cell division septation protein DedD